LENELTSRVVSAMRLQSWWSVAADRRAWAESWNWTEIHNEMSRFLLKVKFREMKKEFGHQWRSRTNRNGKQDKVIKRNFSTKKKKSENTNPHTNTKKRTKHEKKTKASAGFRCFRTRPQTVSAPSNWRK
jgi:hypothetical protein